MAERLAVIATTARPMTCRFKGGCLSTQETEGSKVLLDASRDMVLKRIKASVTVMEFVSQYVGA